MSEADPNKKYFLGDEEIHKGHLENISDLEEVKNMLAEESATLLGVKKYIEETETYIENIKFQIENFDPEFDKESKLNNLNIELAKAQKDLEETVVWKEEINKFIVDLELTLIQGKVLEDEFKKIKEAYKILLTKQAPGQNN